MVRTDVLVLGYPKILRKVNNPNADLRQLAGEVLSLMMEAFSAHRGEIVVLRTGLPADAPIDEATRVRFRMHQGYAPGEYRALEEAGILARSLRRAIEERSSYIMSDTALEDPGDKAISQQLSNGSWMNHALDMNGEVLAFIHLAHPEPERFSADDLAALQDVSMILALVLNVSRLRNGDAS